MKIKRRARLQRFRRIMLKSLRLAFKISRLTNIHQIKMINPHASIKRKRNMLRIKQRLRVKRRGREGTKIKEGTRFNLREGKAKRLQRKKRRIKMEAI